MNHLKLESEPRASIEFHNRIRVERGRRIARAIAWIAGRVVGALRAYRCRQTLRGLNDEQLRDVGLTRADIDRNGWF